MNYFGVSEEKCVDWGEMRIGGVADTGQVSHKPLLEKDSHKPLSEIHTFYNPAGCILKNIYETHQAEEDLDQSSTYF